MFLFYFIADIVIVLIAFPLYASHNSTFYVTEYDVILTVAILLISDFDIKVNNHVVCKWA